MYIDLNNSKIANANVHQSMFRCILHLYGIVMFVCPYEQTDLKDGKTYKHQLWYGSFDSAHMIIIRVRTDR